MQVTSKAQVDQVVSKFKTLVSRRRKAIVASQIKQAELAAKAKEEARAQGSAV